MFRIFNEYLDNISGNMVHVLSAMIVVLLSVYLVNSIRWILTATVTPPDKSNMVVIELIYSIILALGVWLAVLEVTSYEFLSKILQALMVGFGFSIQTPILSLVNGLMMWQNGDVRVGDTISIGDKVSGEVLKVTIMRTYVKGASGQEYIVYNNQLVQNIVQRTKHAKNV